MASPLTSSGSSDEPAILLVDDRPEQRLALSALIAELGQSVVEAPSGREALRCLLQREFALILLDVNMPEMDGFETASLIRQRKSSEHTPIIFVTAHADETYAARGYELGAVDYIQAPVDPQILKTKVSVFLDLFRKTREASRHAEALQRHAVQLRALADAAVAIHGADTLDDLLKVVADTAMLTLGARQLAIEVRAPALARKADGTSRHVLLRPEHTELDALGRRALAGSPARLVRLGSEEFAGDARWRPAEGMGEAPRLRGWMAAPLTSRENRLIGWIQLADKQDGEFGPEDESLLFQLAQMTSIAAENTLFNEAREANRLKDEFLATLSHELRTPLQAILSWARLLSEQPPDRELLRRGLDVIERNARSQSRLMEDLLDVSRIVSDKLLLEEQEVRLADVVRTAVEDARPAADEKQLEIRTEQAADPWILGDANRLRQVLTNLLTNAIKFTPAGGRISIRLAAGAGTAEVSVSDTGKGIAPDFLPHLFERFRQAESSTTRSHGGLGIGLAIVRHLVEQHGGKVHAESEGEDRGATFVLRFPLVEPSNETRIEDARLETDPIRLRGLRVLLVDDEADTRECLTVALRQYGAEVRSARSCREALEQLETHGADVLLSDLAMPDEDGFALIRRVRALASPQGRVPAAALSAHVRGEERARALLAGFDAHLAKPIEPQRIAAAVFALAGRRRV
jgi:signal transduction histidine kinase